jgi:tetraacyldisaccharide 4'-kinase
MQTPPSLAPLMYAPGLLYEGIVRLRNHLYSHGLLEVRRLPAPVISIGNLTLGGTGKTPFAIYAALTLCKMGAVPALLSRGYGRRDPGTMRIVPPGPGDGQGPDTCGDEPALIRRHAPRLWLGIAANRYAAGCRLLESHAATAFILDDGFQHRRLARDLDIVLLDRTQPLRWNRMFPIGSLREPIGGLRRAQIVVLNGAAIEQDDLEETGRRINPAATLLHCTQEIRSLVPLGAWKNGSIEDCGSRPPAFLVAAIGNPRRFASDAAKIGVPVQGTRFYRDHSLLSPQRWEECTRMAVAAGAAAVIITEKDAVKTDVVPAFPVLVAVQESTVTERQDFTKLLDRLLKEKRA